MGSDIAKKFYENWDTGKPIGLALKQTKRSIDGNIENYWSTVFHLYGDPKFGSQGPATAAGDMGALSLIAQTEAPSSVEIVVPDYEVTTINGTDYVEIPGGYALFTPGMPLVPYYRVFYEYPSAYQIQDVVLTHRSEPVTDTGLNIPIAVVAIPGEDRTFEEVKAEQEQEMPECWPLESFDWAVIESPSGKTLALTIYPFYYNPLTTNVRFYKNYDFEIEYTVSDVGITKLQTDKPVYAVGESMKVEIGFNDGETGEIPPEGRDIVVTAYIQEESSGEVIDGLLLRTLKDFRGKAAYTTEWESGGFQPGYYTIVLKLTDTQGTLLDGRIETFRLGISSARLRILPQHRNTSISVIL